MPAWGERRIPVSVRDDTVSAGRPAAGYGAVAVPAGHPWCRFPAARNASAVPKRPDCERAISSEPPPSANQMPIPDHYSEQPCLDVLSSALRADRPIRTGHGRAERCTHLCTYSSVIASRGHMIRQLNRPLFLS